MAADDEEVALEDRGLRGQQANEDLRKRVRQPRETERVAQVRLDLAVIPADTALEETRREITGPHGLGSRVGSELAGADGVGDPFAREGIDEPRRIARENHPVGGDPSPHASAGHRPPLRAEPLLRQAAGPRPELPHRSARVGERRAEPGDADRVAVAVRKNPSVTES